MAASWGLAISLYKANDTDTPSEALQYLEHGDLTGEHVMFNLPAGSYRVVYSSHGNDYYSINLVEISVFEDVCPIQGKSAYI